MKKKSKKPTVKQYSQKFPKLQKLWRFSWPCLAMIAFFWGAIALIPLLFGGLDNMLAFHQWLSQHRTGLAILQATFIVSTLYWWPLLMRWKAKRHGWNAKTLKAASDRKWPALGMLLLVCVVTWII